MKARTIGSLDAMEAFTTEILENLAPRQGGHATVLALSGDLGAGKTVFVKALAKQMGITEHVTSPTFVIMKAYSLRPTVDSKNGFTKLVHIDAYRMSSGSELTMLGWNELLADPKNLIAIEWPEQVAEVMPEGAIKISFEHVDENTRKVSTKHPAELSTKHQAPNSKQ